MSTSAFAATGASGGFKTSKAENLKAISLPKQKLALSHDDWPWIDPRTTLEWASKVDVTRADNSVVAAFGFRQVLDLPWVD